MLELPKQVFVNRVADIPPCFQQNALAQMAEVRGKGRLYDTRIPKERGVKKLSVVTLVWLAAVLPAHAQISCDPSEWIAAKGGAVPSPYSDAELAVLRFQAYASGQHILRRG